METKKNEMLQVLAQNRLIEWASPQQSIVDSYPQINSQNWNVCYYYYLQGEVPTCEYRETDFASPYKQLEEVYSAEFVRCNNGLELIFKQTNGSPACVKPATFWKLLDIGWTSMTPQSIP